MMGSRLVAGESRRGPIPPRISAFNPPSLRVVCAFLRGQSFAQLGRSANLPRRGAGAAHGAGGAAARRRRARLGEALGAPLFETIGGERRLSEAGQALLLHAETIEAAVLAASESDGGGAGPGGHVRLSLSEGLATHVIAPGVAAFHAAHPQIRLELITASGFLNPSKREADIAAMLTRPRNRQLRSSRLLDYRLRLYATRGYLDAFGPPADAAALTDHAL